MNNIVKRYVTAAICIPLLFLIIWQLPSIFFDVIAAIALLIALFEFIHLLNAMDLQINPAVPMLLGITLLAALFGYSQNNDDLWIYSISMLAIFAISFYQLFFHPQDMKIAATSLGSVLYGLFFICVGGGSIILIRELHAPYDGRHMITLLLSIVWTGDAGAMHVGKLIGKNKLSPIISPNKTIEGLLGAVIIGTIGGSVAYWLCGFSFPYWQLVLLSPGLIVMAHAGDLSSSIFKRASKIKDSGRLLPGHGGFLDRLDNIMFSAPFIYLFIRFVWM